MTEQVNRRVRVNSRENTHITLWLPLFAVTQFDAHRICGDMDLIPDKAWIFWTMTDSMGHCHRSVKVWSSPVTIVDLFTILLHRCKIVARPLQDSSFWSFGRVFPQPVFAASRGVVSLPFSTGGFISATIDNTAVLIVDQATTALAVELRGTTVGMDLGK
jgi:hypothetical protein